jgi:hypothetical protein
MPVLITVSVFASVFIFDIEDIGDIGDVEVFPLPVFMAVIMIPTKAMGEPKAMQQHSIQGKENFELYSSLPYIEL